MAGWDLLILMAFVAWSVTLGLRARRRASRSLDEYYLAGREVRGFRAGISMAATQFAVDTPLLFSGLIAVAGVFALWRLWVYGLAFLLMGFLFAAFWRRARILTDAELVEVRYSGRWRLPLRLAKAVYFGLVINSAVLGFVLLAMFQISEIFFPWHAWLPEGPYGAIAAAVASLGVDLSTGAAPYAAELATTNNLISIVLLLLFVGLYSTTGGLRGVIASDLLQFGLAMGGSIAFAVLLLWEVGGPGALVDRVVLLYGADTADRMLSFTPTIEGALMPFLVIMGLQWLFQMNSDGTGYLAQRCMACASDRDARIAATVFAWVQILGRSLVWLVIGVSIRSRRRRRPDILGKQARTTAHRFLQGYEPAVRSDGRCGLVRRRRALDARSSGPSRQHPESIAAANAAWKLSCAGWRQEPVTPGRQHIGFETV